MPPASIWYINRWSGSGASAYKSLDPSSGGNGIMLNTKKLRFMTKNIWAIMNESVPTASPPTRITTAVRIANTKLVNGPATPIRAAPNSSYLTLSGLNGTGLAIKNGWRPKIIRPIGSRTVVNRSICLSGLSVRRPISLAVVSPSQ